MTSLYVGIIEAIKARTGVNWPTHIRARPENKSSSQAIMIPPERTGYLAEIAAVVRQYHAWGEKQERLIRRLWHLDETARALKEGGVADDSEVIRPIKHLQEDAESRLDPKTLYLVGGWEELKKVYSSDEMVFKMRDREIRSKLKTRTLSGTILPRIVLPTHQDPGEILRWRLRENLPGMFPYTAGVFPFKRQDEDPSRMFAGAGDPFRTNRRFKYLSANSEATRLSTAFDLVTRYGRDPEGRPDIYA